MLRSSEAKFHLRLIPSWWYYQNKDPSKESFLVANKFENEITPTVPQYNVPFLTAIHQTISQDSITQHERLTDIQLYGKIAGLTHKATTKAIRKKDTQLISILEDYLKDENHLKDNEEQNDNIDDDKSDNNDIGNDELDELDDDKENHENNSFILNNPNKQTRPRGRLKGTKRIKAYHEKGTSSVINKQYKCSLCGNMGHRE